MEKYRAPPLINSGEINEEDDEENKDGRLHA
jgi:hypothetical protein